MRSVRFVSQSTSYMLPFHRSLHNKSNEAVIVSVARTPVGSLLSSLSDISAPKLGSIAVTGAMEKGNVQPDQIEEVLLGNVISAGQGQSPTRQVSLGAKIPITVPCTTINKVCASGMKSVMFGAQSIMLGYRECVMTGGFESMSNVPFYSMQSRKGLRYGHSQLTDGLLHDGLWDVYNNQHMGMCAEACATKYNISREEQDDYAKKAYERAASAAKEGLFKNEIVPVPVPQRKGEPILVSEDEEYKKIDFSKISSLKPAFKKDGSVTAANSSSLNDGASALLLMSASKATKLGLKPLAKIIGFADAERDPVEFTTAPSDAVPLALKNAGIDIKDVDYWEINEAFAVVAIANRKLLGIAEDRLNIWGGGVSLGHPIGSSGSRIIGTLVNVLHSKGGKIGCASICNGGGGASAIVIERL